MSRESNEKVYIDNLMNKGINTFDPPRNLPDGQCADVSNMRMKPTGGVTTAKAPGEVVEVSSTYITPRGGKYYKTYVSGTLKEYIVVALDSGTATKVFAVTYSGSTVYELTGSTFTTGKRVYFDINDNKIYWHLEGEDNVYYWDGDSTDLAYSTLVAAGGTIPTGAKGLVGWMGRIWLFNTAANPTEIVGSAYRDADYWNDVSGNSLGDRAYKAVIDGAYDDEIEAVVPNVWNTTAIIRTNSIWVFVGTDETDWTLKPVNTKYGTIAPASCVRGNDSVWFLSPYGVKQLSGSSEVSDANRYDTILTTSVTWGIRDKFDEYTDAEKQAAFACMWEDTYRLNIGGDVWAYDLVANNGEGALTYLGNEGSLGAYIESPKRLYGVGASDGTLYICETEYDSLARYSTKEIDFSAPDFTKNINEIRIYGKLYGAYPIYCDYYLNGEEEKAGTFPIYLETGTAASYYIFDSGDSTSVAAGELADTTKTWTANDFVGGVLCDSAGTFFDILANSTTTITVSGTPASGAYILAPNRNCFYTAPGDEEEDWASFYTTSTTLYDSGVNAKLRCESIRLVFRNANNDEPFDIYKFQIRYELTKHKSLGART